MRSGEATTPQKKTLYFHQLEGLGLFTRSAEQAIVIYSSRFSDQNEMLEIYQGSLVACFFSNLYII